MEAANAEMSQKLELAAVMHDSVKGMFNDGLLAQDVDGNYRVVEDPVERAHI